MDTKTNNAVGSPVIVEQTLQAPVSKVWKSLINAEEMKQWYFDIKEFKPQVGFDFIIDVEHQGTRFIHLCRITQVIPEKKLSHTWKYQGHEGNSLVTFELSDENGHTKIRLTHEGTETFPKTAAFAKENFKAGWTSIIKEGLKNYVEMPRAN